MLFPTSLEMISGGNFGFCRGVARKDERTGTEVDAGDFLIVDSPKRESCFIFFMHVGLLERDMRDSRVLDEATRVRTFRAKDIARS